MFNLYTYLNKWERFDLPTKKSAINRMIDISNQYKVYHFMLVENDPSKGPTVETILNEESFRQYLEESKDEFKNEKDMTCLELKKSILKKKGYYNWQFRKKWYTKGGDNKWK